MSMQPPFASLIALVALAMVMSCATHETGHRSERSAPFVLEGVRDLTRVAQLTGKESMNRTDRFGVYGADLGSMFRSGNRTYFVFGDTFGKRSPYWTGAGGEDWRSNTIAYSRDTDPADGITFDGWITDQQGAAKELIHSKKVDNDEITVIPTYGVAVGNAMYLFYMSVKHWGAPGHWTCTYAGVGRSTDGGQTWTELTSPRWPGDSNFVQVSIFQQDRELLMWSIPAGRFGGVTLMKVGSADIEHADRYRYFAGMRDGRPQWSHDMTKAALVVKPPVGELSVIRDNYLNGWIMTYLNEKTHNLEIREGFAPWGPWGPAKTLVSARRYPGLYGAFMLPEYTGNHGRTIYFTMSQWDPYNVFWMRADLVRAHSERGEAVAP